MVFVEARSVSEVKDDIRICTW